MEYRYRMPWGEILTISAHLGDASAPIEYLADEDEWVSTPWQTADVRHDEDAMLRMVVGLMGSDWYWDQSTGMTRDEALAAACDDAVRL